MKRRTLKAASLLLTTNLFILSACQFPTQQKPIPKLFPPNQNSYEQSNFQIQSINDIISVPWVYSGASLTIREDLHYSYSGISITEGGITCSPKDYSTDPYGDAIRSLEQRGAQIEFQPNADKTGFELTLFLTRWSALRLDAGIDLVHLSRIPFDGPLQEEKEYVINIEDLPPQHFEDYYGLELEHRSYGSVK